MSIQKKSSFSLASFLERIPGDFFSHTDVNTQTQIDLVRCAVGLINVGWLQVYLEKGIKLSFALL